MRWLRERKGIGVPQSIEFSALIDGERNTFVVDGNSWAYMMLDTIPSVGDMVTGGDWQLLLDHIETFIQEVSRIGGKLVFVFDNVRPQPKRDSLKKRRCEVVVGKYCEGAKW